MENRIDSDISEDLNEKLAEKYQNLNYIRSEKVKRTILRSKIKIYEQNEKPSKYFCSLERAKRSNSLYSMIMEANVLITLTDIG